jgi:hypothetical protein
VKNNRSIDNASPSEYEEDIKCMKERLTRCLQLLKIDQDSQIGKTAFELLEKTSRHSEMPQRRSWISALDSIAGSCLLYQRAFSQSQVYDFLTVAVTTSLEGRNKAIDELIFRVYRDIMITYESLDEKSKIAYPKIIVDVVAILSQGFDTKGRKIPIHNVDVYYQTRKSDAPSIPPLLPASETVVITTPTVTTTTAKAAGIKSIEMDIKRKVELASKSELVPSHYKEPPTNKDEEEADLVEVLNKITDRSKKDIQSSFAKLEKRDVLRIRDLCKNYSKIQKYSKLITETDDLQKFKTTLQNESGRKLSDHQIQHAANSVRKAKLYIENVLDGKFTPHGSYGINHTKHNLEYGYLIVGLMQSSRKRSANEGGKT